MDNPESTPKDILDAIQVDYERVDVAALMAQIEKEAAAAPAPEPGTPASPPAPPAAAGPPPAAPSATTGLPAPPAPDPGPAGLKSKLQGRAIRLLTPFFPFMRLLGLPLHQELRETQQSLHATNIRIDGIVRELGGNLDAARRELGKSREYIKLLHNLSHNLIMVTTSQKIELDMLKSKVRVMEKDLEYLQKRERALEEKSPT
jgi:pyruvate/2-oxoglutarate dehydrogenase complex dihydrolipoamide acyltransferase (E2) component